jgi:hypothetical protein
MGWSLDAMIHRADPLGLAVLPLEEVSRYRARWRRGLQFRADWGYLVHLLLYISRVDPEGIA